MSTAAAVDTESNFKQSRAIRVGNHVFASASATRRVDGKWLADPEDEARHCFLSIVRSLAEVSASPQHIVRLWTWQRHIGLAAASQRPRAEILGDVRPAVTGLMVVGFPDPYCDFRIEVEAVIDGKPEQISVDLPGIATTQAAENWSRVVRVGSRIYVSCTAPIWPARPGAGVKDRWCDPDPEKQALRCFETIGAALERAGAGYQHVVTSHLWLQNAADGPAVARAHNTVFGAARPASSMVVLQGYLRPQWHVEIEAEADLAAERHDVGSADRSSTSTLSASQAVRAGDRVSVSAVGPCRAGEPLGADMATQLRQCWATTRNSLAEAGARPEHVVRARFYIRHPADSEEVARFTHEVFGDKPPSVSVLIVKGFLCPEARLEMEVEAIVSLPSAR